MTPQQGPAQHREPGECDHVRQHRHRKAPRFALTALIDPRVVNGSKEKREGRYDDTDHPDIDEHGASQPVQHGVSNGLGVQPDDHREHRRDEHGQKRQVLRVVERLPEDPWTDHQDCTAQKRQRPVSKQPPGKEVEESHPCDEQEECNLMSHDEDRPRVFEPERHFHHVQRKFNGSSVVAVVVLEEVAVALDHVLVGFDPMLPVQELVPRDPVVTGHTKSNRQQHREEEADRNPLAPRSRGGCRPNGLCLSRSVGLPYTPASGSFHADAFSTPVVSGAGYSPVLGLTPIDPRPGRGSDALRFHQLVRLLSFGPGLRIRPTARPRRRRTPHSQ